ncbi:PhaM family polyhydroxyalkanoate granule multifunctional regulatory protein [Ramlibacter sp.]|uniref:PhaM family polyhydroxyalkanoate granule multifunctional regulatory protein n=1 Tax=Ramlibacter sp. TaxID=1917967 RepID=UPI002D3A612F|nr:PhaM family polyhydroxyalkanoate granule multifunctional regulatory protein [Ramlibacter sp.]HYD77377.1 PhaM family polyhydroxyalkanoate granule multifunctional regulatory protein [Ramlibacter sp.]
MSEQDPLGFGKFVPGFDFLQNLAKGAGQSIPQMPNLANWVAPTLNVEELEKRIEELKAVHFWLDQNSKALAATVQALEVQKMTLATLKGMNFNMGDVANALKLKAADTVLGGVQKVTETAAGAAGTVSGVARAASGRTSGAKAGAKGGAKAADGVVDPMQWWGALTQQFQQIAADALKDATRNTAIDTARHMATGLARDAVRSAGGVMRGATPGAGSKKAARKTSTGTAKARKPAPRKRATNR